MKDGNFFRGLVTALAIMAPIYGIVLITLMYWTTQ